MKLKYCIKLHRICKANNIKLKKFQKQFIKNYDPFKPENNKSVQYYSIGRATGRTLAVMILLLLYSDLLDNKAKMTICFSDMDFNYMRQCEFYQREFDKLYLNAIKRHVKGIRRLDIKRMYCSFQKRAK